MGKLLTKFQLVMLIASIWIFIIVVIPLWAIKNWGYTLGFPHFVYLIIGESSSFWLALTLTENFT